MLDDQGDPTMSPFLIRDYLIAILVLSLGLGTARAIVTEFQWLSDEPEATCIGMWVKSASEEKSARAILAKARAIVDCEPEPAGPINLQPD